MNEKENIKKQLKEDIQYLRENVEKTIKEIDSNKNYLHKNILLFSFFDRFTQDNIFHDKKSNNCEKFITFINDYSGWDKCNAYDPVLLYYYLNEKLGDTKALHDKLESMLREKGILTEGFLEFPLYINRLNNINAINLIENEKDYRDELKKFRYPELLWKFRNKIIHEFQFPYSNGFEEQDEKNGINDLNYQCIDIYDEQRLEGDRFQSQIQLIIPYIKIKEIFLKSIDSYLKRCEEESEKPIIDRKRKHWYEE